MEFLIFLISLTIGCVIFFGFVAILLAILWGLLLALRAGVMWLRDLYR